MVIKKMFTIQWTIVGFLMIVDVQINYGITQEQIDQRFKTYSIIEPKLYHTKNKTEIKSTKWSETYSEHVNTVLLTIIDNGKKYLIDLHHNRKVIVANYFEKYQQNDLDILSRPNASEIEHCNFHGILRKLKNSWAAISMCDGIRGTFFDGVSYRYIENFKDEFGDIYHVLYKSEDFKTDQDFGFPPKNLKIVSNEITRTKRSVETSMYTFDRKIKRFIELVLVIDHGTYQLFDSNDKMCVEYAADIANKINSFYVQLNVFVALVGVIVWKENDEIPIFPDIQKTLDSFADYCINKIKIPNDNVQLLTTVKFDNNIVGRAYKGTMCSYEKSVGVISRHNLELEIFASAIAHEMGHNLGMDHDSNYCVCPSKYCVMDEGLHSSIPTHWSSCSVKLMRKIVERDIDCLKNEPQKPLNTPKCGNYFVDQGEECDCGPKTVCDNPCCNPDTCRLYKNASCASGECCDLKTCRLKSTDAVCRSALQECDLPEYCSGKSENCPENVYKIDGSACNNRGAFCYEGVCRSHDDQCRLLWGVNTKSSPIECYQLNKNGWRVVGNCGYNPKIKTGVKCENDDTLCGRLMCNDDNQSLKPDFQHELSIYSVNHNLRCRAVVVNVGMNDVDPGMTPNGAKCGENKMCINQKCVKIENLRENEGTCLYNCNNHGVCDNKKRCHCDNGYAPPYCKILPTKTTYITDFPGVVTKSIDTNPRNNTGILHNDTDINLGKKGKEEGTVTHNVTFVIIITIVCILIILTVFLFFYCMWKLNSKKSRETINTNLSTGNVRNQTVAAKSVFGSIKKNDGGISINESNMDSMSPPTGLTNDRPRKHQLTIGHPKLTFTTLSTMNYSRRI